MSVIGALAGSLEPLSRAIAIDPPRAPRTDAFVSIEIRILALGHWRNSFHRWSRVARRSTRGIRRKRRKVIIKQIHQQINQIHQLTNCNFSGQSAVRCSVYYKSTTGSSSAVAPVSDGSGVVCSLRPTRHSTCLSPGHTGLQSVRVVIIGGRSSPDSPPMLRSKVGAESI